MPRYLVIGSGGREHAIAWKLASEPNARVWVAPGSDGIGDTDGVECVDIAPGEHDALAAFAREHEIDLTVVGPEAPLVAGLADEFRTAGLTILGPGAGAAMLEGSKAFAKDVMRAAAVPTAAYESFDRLDDAIRYATDAPHPLVIKADGLAGGKGVVISESIEVSRNTLTAFMRDERFGAASSHVVIEECLRGPELSFMVVTDGEGVVTLSTSRDHKRLLDGDRGPNTGGMGAVTPSPDTSAELEAMLVEEVVRPVLAELAARGLDYRGFLYAGMMLTEDGPRVLEFNVRLGDPETQALMFAMEAELGPTLTAAARGELLNGTLATQRCACCVVLAAQGYPAAPRKGDDIAHIPTTNAAMVFHAGTTYVDGKWQTAGGRVLGATARGNGPSEAQRNAYALANAIEWDGRQLRSDIGAPD